MVYCYPYGPPYNDSEHTVPQPSSSSMPVTYYRQYSSPQSSPQYVTTPRYQGEGYSGGPVRYIRHYEYPVSPRSLKFDEPKFDVYMPQRTIKLERPPRLQRGPKLDAKEEPPRIGGVERPHTKGETIAQEARQEQSHVMSQSKLHRVPQSPPAPHQQPPSTQDEPQQESQQESQDKESASSPRSPKVVTISTTASAPHNPNQVATPPFTPPRAQPPLDKPAHPSYYADIFSEKVQLITDQLTSMQATVRKLQYDRKYDE